MESEANISETWGLLDQDHDADGPVGDVEIPRTFGLTQKKRKRIEAFIANGTYRLTASAFLVYFLLEFSLLTLQVLGSRLFECAVCRRYYGDILSFETFFHILGEIDERLCKIAPIQREVALLAGWRDSFLAIPSESPV
jgi:hypothetical protein